MKILALEKEVSGVVEQQFTERLLQAEAVRAFGSYTSRACCGSSTSAPTGRKPCWCWNAPAPAKPVHLESLPLVEAGLIDFEIVRLAPHPGFARLFAGKR